MQFRIAEPELDKSKLLAVVHHVCANCNVSELGNVKLHKILYFSDMFHFVATGKALTGVPYVKQQFGPVAKFLTWATEELVHRGLLEVEKREYFGFQKVDYRSKQKPQQNILSNFEVQIIGDVIDFVCARSAREISELSHTVAWESVKMGAPIPYFSAFGMYLTSLSEVDLISAENEVRNISPIVEADKHARGIL